MWSRSYLTIVCIYEVQVLPHIVCDIIMWSRFYLTSLWIKSRSYLTSFIYVVEVLPHKFVTKVQVLPHKFYDMWSRSSLTSLVNQVQVLPHKFCESSPGLTPQDLWIKSRSYLTMFKIKSRSYLTILKINSRSYLGELSLFQVPLLDARVPGPAEESIALDGHGLDAIVVRRVKVEGRCQTSRGTRLYLKQLKQTKNWLQS